MPGACWEVETVSLVGENRRTGAPPVLTYIEVLRRAKSDILRELDVLERRNRDEGLPRACYSDERLALGSKLSAVNTLIYYESGEYNGV